MNRFMLLNELSVVAAPSRRRKLGVQRQGFLVNSSPEGIAHFTQHAHGGDSINGRSRNARWEIKRIDVGIDSSCAGRYILPSYLATMRQLVLLEPTALASPRCRQQLRVERRGGNAKKPWNSRVPGLPSWLSP